MNKKYKLGKSILVEHNGKSKILRQVVALKDFHLQNQSIIAVKAGDFGGWVESEDNLSQKGDCWLKDDCCLFGRSRLEGDAILLQSVSLFDDVVILGTTSVSGKVDISGNVWIEGFNVIVGQDVKISGSLKISGMSMINGNNININANGVIEGYNNIYSGATIDGNISIKGNVFIDRNFTSNEELILDGRVHIGSNCRFIGSNVISGCGGIEDNSYLKNRTIKLVKVSISLNDKPNSIFKVVK